jgi:hypothetical protein
MVLWALPHIAWCVHGTVISFWDIMKVAKRPLFSGIVAAAAGLSVQLTVGPYLPALARLVLGCAVLFGSYAAMLLYVMGQKPVYMDLIHGMWKQPTVETDVVTST